MSFWKPVRPATGALAWAFRARIKHPRLKWPLAVLLAIAMLALAPSWALIQLGNLGHWVGKLVGFEEDW